MLLLLLSCLGGRLDQGAPPQPGDGGGSLDGGSLDGGSLDGGAADGAAVDGGDTGEPPDNALWPDQAVYELGERVRIDLRGSGEVVLLPAGSHDAAASPWRQTPALPDSPVLFLPVSLTEGPWEAWLLQSGAPVAKASFSVVSGASDPVPATQEGAITAMSFNIWENAAKSGCAEPDCGPLEVARVIAEADADLVALQDCSRSTLGTIAEALRSRDGYQDLVAIEDARILSRFPLVELHLAGVYAYGASVSLPDGSLLRVFNAHLTGIPSGLELAATAAEDGGAEPAEIRTLEGKTRAAELATALELLVDAEAQAPERPTLLMGTFNAPSHLDWTEAAADQHWGLVLDWPTSGLMEAAGFVDTFRTAWPDPVAVRGFSRTPGAPRGSFALDTLHDRLDYVFARPSPGGSVEVLSAWTMDREPWPSDHRAVVSRLVLRPAEQR